MRAKLSSDEGHPKKVTALQICGPLKRAFVFNVGREPGLERLGYFLSSADAD
jgi:hypothetical protein